ncbi:MAG: hypothetical protein ACE5F1_10660 [Planctomycetota bacterium]
MHWKGRKNPGFNFVQRKGDKASKSFLLVERARIVCDIHDWASCQVHVVPHPVFAVTDEHGRFSLPKLPDGKYELVATRELLGTRSQEVLVRGKPRKWVTFVFKVPPGLKRR